jgi:hypothetical protein
MAQPYRLLDYAPPFLDHHQAHSVSNTATPGVQREAGNARWTNNGEQVSQPRRERIVYPGHAQRKTRRQALRNRTGRIRNNLGIQLPKGQFALCCPWAGLARPWRGRPFGCVKSRSLPTPAPCRLARSVPSLTVELTACINVVVLAVPADG